MIKKLIIFISLVIFSSLLCLILFSKREYFAGKTIQFASWGSETEVNIIKPILADFEKENPNIKIDFMHIPQNYFQKIHLLFASNTAPDVIFINNLYLPVYANAGVLEPLTQHSDYLEVDNFYKQSLQVLSLNKELYAIPRDISNMVIFYNKDIFNKAGIPCPNEGWTLDDMMVTLKKLSSIPNIFGISFEEQPIYYLPFLVTYGGWTQNDLDNYFAKDIFDNEANKKGLEFYANIRTKYHYAPYKGEIASATMAQMFLQGKVAMHISGRWLVPKYREEANFDWDIIEFPRLNKSSKSVVPIDSSGWSISKSCKNKKEALRLIKYLSSEQSSQKFAKSGLITPARKDVANSKIFLDGQKPKHSIYFIKAIETGKPSPQSLIYNKIIDDLKSRTEDLFNKK